MKVAAQSPGKLQYVRIFLLGGSQSFYLVIKLRVNSPAGLAQLLIEGLPGALVGGDGPPLDVLQLVVLHQGLPRTAGGGERDTAGC